jgi:hypothetical protein
MVEGISGCQMSESFRPRSRYRQPAVFRHTPFSSGTTTPRGVIRRPPAVSEHRPRFTGSLRFDHHRSFPNGAMPPREVLAFHPFSSASTAWRVVHVAGRGVWRAKWGKLDRTLSKDVCSTRARGYWPGRP